MSKFSMKVNPLLGVGSIHIKKGVKIAGWSVVAALVLVILYVVAGKGQGRQGGAPSNTPSPINASQSSNSSLESVLEKKPTTAVAKAAPTARAEEPRASTGPSEEALARQQRQRAAAEARQAMLTEAVYSGMNVRIDTVSLTPSAPQPSAPITLASNRLSGAQDKLRAQTLGSAAQEQDGLDNTLVSQAAKAEFLARSPDTGYLPHTRTRPMSGGELTVGTVIPATLISAMNSDIPGNVIAQVSQNVYDSATGAAILIPQGTQLYGTYDSRVAYGQRRLPVTWSRVNFPDGTKLNIGHMASMDVTGKNGLTGAVNNHYWRLFGQATLLGGISGMTQAGVSDGNDDSRSAAESVADGVVQQYAQTGNALIRKNMNIQPTIEIDNAEQFYIMVSQDIVLPPYSPL
ncbi:TrbI/VirB10 family protein [uncultured Vibrio sp.]|uniref:TrbI/VirB10 family protein n=1 Tax=uncultured Vibrio sp. TaxID=114054 RepID=UPI0026165F5A|nr:TrbI/VirB10 family protein [uncultured Vibrio sp.]